MAVEGAVRVVVTTTGADTDVDGYSVAADGAPAQAVEINGTVVVAGLSSGSHSVLLAGIAENCVPSGANPRTVTVTAGDTLAVAFGVACVQVTGSVQVTTTTTGTDLDPDGYEVIVDGAPSGHHVGINEVILVGGLSAGDHTVALFQTANNCPVSGANPRTVTVTAGDTVPVAFEIACWDETPIGQIAFTSVVCDYNGCGPQSIAIVNADGSDLKLLTGPGSFDGAAWSPDGMRIAFDDGGHIYVMDADGSNLTQLTNTIAREPAWSPDGSKIAYFGGGICVMNADGSNPICITTSGWGPTWSPDGTRIAFSSGQWGYRQIYVVHPDGSDAVAISDPGCFSQPTWSPDGMKIAFTICGEEGAEGLRIVWRNADGLGGGIVALDGMNPAWKP